MPFREVDHTPHSNCPTSKPGSDLSEHAHESEQGTAFCNQRPALYRNDVMIDPSLHLSTAYASFQYFKVALAGRRYLHGPRSGPRRSQRHLWEPLVPPPPTQCRPLGTPADGTAARFWQRSSTGRMARCFRCACGLSQLLYMKRYMFILLP